MSDISRALRDLASDSIRQLRGAVAAFKDVCYANSLGAESMVLTDLIWTYAPEIEIFTIDTGRLHPETYELMERLQRRYGRALQVYYPDAEAVENWVASHGINGFLGSIEQRRTCCGTRKIQPFRRAIRGRRAWVTGIRRDQSADRALAMPLEWDRDYGLYKVSPLLAWRDQDVWRYIRSRQLPYNPLHDAGFPSIGCAPCSRAVQPGDDARSGRWWWERADSRECGLHARRAIFAEALAGDASAGMIE
ncbi:MAG TPA: phosphoadenylyl-sulfate reductase [Steroidobacteraceae bacterium]|nr:phosphoadenylyl-sulfate reductase [Steroidobacteraceae bacterium]